MFGASSFEAHRAVGYLVGLLILILLLLALIRRGPRRLLGMSALLAVLVIVQVLLPSLRTSVPFVAALHTVNALALLGVTATIMRSARLP
jgi:heme A synthase